MEPSSALPIDGLLHLGALAVIITAGYLGVDKIHSERHDFYKMLNDVTEEIRTLLEAEKGATKIALPELLMTQNVYVLCYVAKLKVVDRPVLTHLPAIWYKAKYAPFLDYFRCKADRVVTSIAGIVSLAGFLWLVDISMYPDGGVGHPVLGTILYWWYLTAVCWVFVTAAIAATRLNSLRSICTNLHASVAKATSALSGSKIAASLARLSELPNGSK